MKRTISTIVLFVLLLLTVVALAKIGKPKDTSAMPATSSTTVSVSQQTR